MQSQQTVLPTFQIPTSESLRVVSSDKFMFDNKVAVPYRFRCAVKPAGETSKRYHCTDMLTELKH